MIKEQDIIELYNKLVTQIPPYIENEIRQALEREEKNSLAYDSLEKYLENVRIAREERIPICQDTGIPKFLIKLPKGYSYSEIEKVVLGAMPKATKEAYARESGVDIITNEQRGNQGIATFYFEEWNREYPLVSLLLKGGGSENAGMLFSLPDCNLNADRDKKGIRKCVEYVVKNKVPNACPPVILSIGLGGTRDKAIETSQKLLFRKWGERSSELGDFEKELYEFSNSLGIGPQGFGGKTSVFDVRIGKLPRHIATYFVDVSVNCWVYRMGNLSYENGLTNFFW